MRKVFLAVIVAFIINAAPAIYAQTTQDSEYYYVSVPIEKIYVYKGGYIVLYQRGFRLTRTYIPMEWFTNPTGKADLITMGSGSNWPYLTIYYKEGEFSHIRLYVRRSRGHETWGVVPFNVDLDSYFRNIEEIHLDL